MQSAGAIIRRNQPAIARPATAPPLVCACPAAIGCAGSEGAGKGSHVERADAALSPARRARPPRGRSGAARGCPEAATSAYASERLRPVAAQEGGPWLVRLWPPPDPDRKSTR